MVARLAIKFLPFVFVPILFEEKCKNIPSIHVGKCCAPPDLFKIVTQTVLEHDENFPVSDLCVSFYNCLM